MAPDDVEYCCENVLILWVRICGSIGWDAAASADWMGHRRGTFESEYSGWVLEVEYVTDRPSDVTCTVEKR